MKIFLLEGFNYKKSESYGNNVFLVEAPKQLTIVKLFNGEIELKNDKDFYYSNIEKNEHMVSYVVNNRFYEHLKIDNNLYEEQMTCYNFEKITKEEIEELEEKFEVTTDDDYITTIYVENEEDLVKYANENNIKINGVCFEGKGYYTFLYINEDEFDIKVVDIIPFYDYISRIEATGLEDVLNKFEVYEVK